MALEVSLRLLLGGEYGSQSNKGFFCRFLGKKKKCYYFKLRDTSAEFSEADLLKGWRSHQKINVLSHM